MATSMTGMLRTGGRVAACVLGAVGLVAATSVVVPVALLVGVLAGVAGHIADLHRAERHLTERHLTERPAGPRPGRWDRSVRFAATGIGATAVVGGLAVLTGPVAAPVVLLGLGAAAWRLRPREADRQAPTGNASGPAGDDGVAERLVLLSGAQLEGEWRRSHARLARVRDPAELARVLALRRRQLDEMERRDPQGFRRWAGSGAWILGDRAPFLHRAARLDRPEAG